MLKVLNDFTMQRSNKSSKNRIPSILFITVRMIRFIRLIRFIGFIVSIKAMEINLKKIQRYWNSIRNLIFRSILL